MTIKSIFSCGLLPFTFLLFSGTTIFAQYEALQNDPSITWIAEFTTDHDFALNTSSSQNIVKLIKFHEDPVSTSKSNEVNWVNNWLLNDAMTGQTDCFEDPGLTQSLSIDDLKAMTSSIDTVTTFNPDTYEEQIRIIRNELSIRQIKQLRINQIIYYNNKTEDFETKLISLAPLLEYGKNKSLRPLFWIKMDESIPAKFDIHAPDITWGVLAYSKAHPMALNFMEEVKNTNGFNFAQHILLQGQKMKKPVESSQCYGCKDFLNQKEINNMYNSIDTVTTFDPETYQEEIMIIKNEIEPGDISQYRLVQEWYYDTKKKRLMNRLKAIAPIINVSDRNGNFKYSKSLYYIRYNSWQ